MQTEIALKNAVIITVTVLIRAHHPLTRIHAGIITNHIWMHVEVGLCSVEMVIILLQ